MTPITRFITTQGPAQLCTVLAVLFDERERNPHQCYEDHLILHGCYVGDKTDHINAAMRDLARVWEWRSVICLDEFETKLRETPHCSREQRVAALQQFIKLPCPQEIYLVRNWQETNELLLHAYRGAKKINYGDSLGQIDSYEAPSYVQFDEIRTLQPFRSFSLSRERVIDLKSIPIRIAARDSFRRVLDRYLAVSDSARTYSEKLGRDAARTIIIVFKNGGESRITQLEKEIAIYLNAATAAAQPGDLVLLKPHPRETLHQSRIVQELLRRFFDIEATVMGAGSFLGHLPLEIFLINNRFKRILSPLVTATARQLKFLFDVDVEEKVTEEMLQVMAPERKRHYLSAQYINEKVIENQRSWDGNGPVFEWNDDHPDICSLHRKAQEPSRFWPNFSPLNATIADQLKRLSDALTRQDVGNVRTTIVELVNCAPQDLRLLLELARIAFQIGDHPTSQRAYEAATVWEPSSAAAHHGFAQVLRASGADRHHVEIAETCARYLEG